MGNEMGILDLSTINPTVEREGGVPWILKELIEQCFHTQFLLELITALYSMTDPWISFFFNLLIDPININHSCLVNIPVSSIRHGYRLAHFPYIISSLSALLYIQEHALLRVNSKKTSYQTLRIQVCPKNPGLARSIPILFGWDWVPRKIL